MELVTKIFGEQVAKATQKLPYLIHSSEEGSGEGRKKMKGSFWVASERSEPEGRHHEPECVRWGIKPPRAPRVASSVRNRFELHVVNLHQYKRPSMGLLYWCSQGTVRFRLEIEEMEYIARAKRRPIRHLYRPCKQSLLELHSQAIHK